MVSSLTNTVDNVLADTYNWLGIDTYPEADFMENYDPMVHQATNAPIIAEQVAKKAFDFLMQALQAGSLDVSEEFVRKNFAQILLTENLYYYPIK